MPVRREAFFLPSRLIYASLLNTPLIASLIVGGLCNPTNTLLSLLESLAGTCRSDAS